MAGTPFLRHSFYKFLSKINDPKIVTERLKKDIIKLVIDEVVIKGESVKIFATIPLPNKIHEREMDKTDIPGPLRRSFSETSTFNAGATLGPINETNMTRIWNKHKQTNTPLKPRTSSLRGRRKVFVAMSGGVDSSVAALILKQEGYDVIGAHIKSWDEGCEWKEERRYAVKNCAKLDIPFITLDLTKEYKKEVIEYMIKEYEAGRTPNPDVMCNKRIKFGAFLKKTVEMGADYIATGHYIRISQTRNSDKFPISNFQFPNKSKIQNFKLLQAKDKNKDQSYFLWTLTQEQLKYCLFPIGDYLKPEVRKIAKHYELPSAAKKDSQGLCFVGKVKFNNFLENLIQKQNNPKQCESGAILSEEGRVLGRHHGLCFYTIGQRGGLGIGGRKEEKEMGPLYVAEKDYSANTLIAVKENSPRLFKKELAANSLNWINPDVVKSGEEFMCRIRYRQPLEKCRIEIINEEKIRVVFDEPQRAIAPGQSIVFYKGQEMLGGGIIC